MDGSQWFMWFLGIAVIPYALLAAYRYMGKLYGGL